MGPAPELEALDLDALVPPFHARDEAQRWLFQLHRLGMRPGLERIRDLLRRMGDPQERLSSVVVAGTNGKGSAAIYFQSLAGGAGLRTGLYTSPHLLDLRERIQVDGHPIPSEDLAALVREFRDDIEASGATFFEAMTGLALVHFAREGVELAVLETGLGGRLDATNAVPALGILLTSIGADHQHILGVSLREITHEKIGLAKPGVPFFLAPLPEDVHRFAVDTLKETGAEVVDLGALAPMDSIHAQRGEHQAKLAAVVGEAWRRLAQRQGWPAGEIEEELARVRLPARFEWVGTDPPLIVDTAHNAPALRGLVRRFQREGRCDERILILGVMRDKKVDPVLAELRRSAGRILVTAPRWVRARRPQDLAEAMVGAPGGGDHPVEIAGGVRESLESARRWAREISRSGGSPRILLTGSNFTVAEALDRLGIDDIFDPPRSPVWEQGAPLRRRKQP